MKSSKAEAKYKSKAEKRSRRCAVCTMFRPPSACTAVAGEISPDATCRFFEAKKGRSPFRSASNTVHERG